MIFSFIKWCAAFLVLLVFVQVRAQDSESLQKQFGKAQQALASGNYSEAEQMLEKLAGSDPSVAEIHANLGLVYFQEKKFTQAVPELRRALKLKPALTDSQFFLSMSLSELGRYNEALPGLEKGFHSSRPDMKRMCGLQLERAYTGLDQNRKAVEVALELAQLYPRDPEILFHNGTIFGNFAYLSMQQLFNIAPNSVWSHQAAAEAFESQNAYGSAIGEYNQVLAIDPRRPGVHYRLGRTLLARARATNSADDLNAAIKEFEQELKVDPLNASAAYEIGEIRRTAGEYAAAQTYFELALKNFPDFEEAHLGLASVLNDLGKPDLAVVHLQKAISLRPDDDVSWYRLARVEQALGHKDEAQKALSKFHELHSQKLPHEPSLFSTEEVTKQTVGEK